GSPLVSLSCVLSLLLELRILGCARKCSGKRRACLSCSAWRTPETPSPVRTPKSSRPTWTHTCERYEIEAGLLARSSSVVHFGLAKQVSRAASALKRLLESCECAMSPSTSSGRWLTQKKETT